MSCKAFAYKHLVLYKDSQIPRAGFLSSQILYPLEILKFFILFFYFRELPPEQRVTMASQLNQYSSWI